MINLFRPKTMRRMAVFAALVAPIVYLFGSLFTALAGAHGTQVFADKPNEQVLDYPITMYSDKWISYQGVVYDFVGNWVSSEVVLNPSDGTFVLDFPVEGISNAIIALYDGDTFVARNNIVVNGSYSFVPDGTYDRVRFGFAYPSESSPSSLTVNFSGSFVSEGPYFGAVAYSDYIFKNFFAKDNFLVEWGENAISESPYGFAPFGYFWRYLDENILHLSSEQVGLMAYGYMYYAAHVLLFDVGFMLVTFFLSFIQKVGDKIGGEER